MLINCREENKKTIEKLIPIQETFSIEKENDPQYSFYYPQDIKIDRDGNIYVLDTNNSRIQIFNRNGEYLRTIGEPGQGPGEFNKPESIYIDETENMIYISDTRNQRLQVFSLDGKFISLIKLNFAPQQVVLSNSNIYVTRFPSTMVYGNSPKSKSLIKKLDRNGNIINEFLIPLDTGYHLTNLLVNSITITTDENNNLICAYKLGINRIMKFDHKDNMVLEFKTIYKAWEWAKPGEFINISSEEDIEKLAYVVADIACDKENNIYILSGNLEKKKDGNFEKAREIYKFDPYGKYTGTLILPLKVQLIEFDKENHLFIIDHNFIIRKFKLLSK
ncbi:MAG: NHL repeat-containing protein [Elusimicrobiota bacterium]